MSGLLIEDARMWARGQMAVIMDGRGYKVVKDELYADTKEKIVVMEDPLGARWSISVSPDFVQADGTVTIEPAPIPESAIMPREKRTKANRAKIKRRQR